ncbi:MAG: hypothetical protein PVH13_04340 [Gammaproteobacteria bacterium]
MRMSVDNLDTIRGWAIRNQDAVPELAIRLIFAADLAKSVIEQEAAPDPQRVIEIGFDIANLLWRIRVSASPVVTGVELTPTRLAAGTRVVHHALRRGMQDTAIIAEYIDQHVGKIIYAADVVGHDIVLDMPEFGFREITVQRDGEAYVFEDLSDPPCRPSRIKNLSSSISKIRQTRQA